MYMTPTPNLGAVVKIVSLKRCRVKVSIIQLNADLNAKLKSDLNIGTRCAHALIQITTDQQNTTNKKTKEQK